MARSDVTLTEPIDPTVGAVPQLPGTAIRPPANAAGSSTSNDRSPVVIGIGVMVAALVAVLLIVMISDNDSSDETPPPATEATSTNPSPEEPPSGEG